LAALNAPKRTATVLSGCSFGTKCTACGDHLSYDIGCRLSDARARLSTIFGVVALGWLVKNE
jgi:hypothetical protein